MARKKIVQVEALNHLIAESEVNAPVPTDFKLAPMQANIWETQPDAELGIHESVTTTLRQLKEENAKLQQQILNNDYATNKIIAGQIEHYQIPYNRTRPIRFRNDFAVMCIPQFDKRKEVPSE